MDYEDKTREQLIQAMESLCRRVAELEASVAEERRTREILANAKWQLEHTFDTVPDLIAIIDNGYRIIRMNRALLDKLECSPTHSPGLLCYEYLCGGDQPHPHCPHALMKEDGREHSETMFMEELCGEYLVTASPLRNADGDVVASVHVARDISPLKNAERALMESESKFRTLVEQALVGIYLVHDERFLYVNPRLAEIFGYSRDELLSLRSVTDLVAEADRAYTLENFQRQLSGTIESIHFVLKGRRKGGELIDVEIHGSRTELNGKPVIIGSLLDITEKLATEQERMRLKELRYREEKELSILALAGGIAHDFNNILMAVTGNAELLTVSLEPGSKEREFADHIIRAARRMSSLTQQLLAYSKTGVYERRVLSVGRLLNQACSVAEKVKPSDIMLDISLPEDLWSVFVDPNHMSHAFVSLFANASDAMEESGGTITVTASNVVKGESWRCPLTEKELPPGGYVHITVGDTGSGVPEELRQKIFEPFFTTKSSGRGLGLSAAAGIVQSHGGCIFIESEKDKGSTLHVYLPSSPVEETAVRAAQALRKDGRHAKVLIVDDEPQILSLLETVLTRLGHEVIVVDSSLRALDIFRKRSGEFALAILDIRMPGMDGKKLFGELKAIKPELRVIISSGYDEKTALEGMKPFVPDGFVQKPYRVRTIEDTLHQILSDN